MEFTGERVVPDKMALDARTYQEHLMRYVWALKYCIGRRILDVASGCGYGLDLISGVAKEVFGIEKDFESVEYSKKHFQFSNRPFNFQCLDLDFADWGNTLYKKAFDVVTSFETIEHLDRPDFFLQNIKDSLVPGGLFVFSIPNTSLVKFHKKLYDLKQTKNLIDSYFKDVIWYGQTGQTIGDISEDSDFFLGVAYNK